MTTERCTCGETACESELCDCDATPCPVNHRAEQAEAARDALQATLKRIRVAVITAYGEDYAGGDTAVDVERLLRHLAEYEADMRRLLQSKNEALERAQAERDALKAELAETLKTATGLAEDRAEVLVELAEARAAIGRVKALHFRNANSGGCEYCSDRDYPNYFVPWPCDTFAALDAPQRPEDRVAERIREQSNAARRIVAAALTTPERPEDTREATEDLQ